VLVRSTFIAGKVNITAASKGLKTGVISFSTIPFKEKDGLSKMMPADGLQVNVSKGPTPLTPSFTIIRKAQKIIKLNAGSNSNDAIKSTDDNELSVWQSDGTPNNNWIEYELENIATINQIELKLNNFRTKQYHLRITIDGNEAYNGLTEKTLGYYTIQCKPLAGSKVRIELLGNQKNQDVPLMNEVNGKKLDDGMETKAGVNMLGIIEAEIYSDL